MSPDMCRLIRAKHFWVRIKYQKMFHLSKSACTSRLIPEFAAVTVHNHVARLSMARLEDKQVLSPCLPLKAWIATLEILRR